MCDRYMSGVSLYICERCWGDLLKDRSDWPDVMTEQRLREYILKFMATAPTGKFLRGDELEDLFLRMTR